MFDREPDALRWLLAGGAVLVLWMLVFLSFGGARAHAAFPGINGKLFCVEASAPGPATKAQNIFSINADGSGRALVTNTTFIDPVDPTSGFANNSFPSVSPDGKKMVFSSNRDDALSIYVMSADGIGPATRLTTPVAPAFGDLFSTWAPDGQSILFTRLFPGGDGEIFSMNADGSNQVNLTNRTTQEVAPAVSPDGTKILFHSNRNFAPTTARDQDIYSMNRDGSDVQNLTNDSRVDALDVFATWSPDGRQFVFERAQNDGTTNFAFSNVYTMNADGTGAPTQLTFATTGLAASSRNRNPTWSPDGTRISFDSERDNPPAPEPPNREAYTMKTDGSDVQRVTNAPGSDADCDWQTIPRPAAIVPPPAAIVPPPAAIVPPPPPPAAAIVRRKGKLSATVTPSRDLTAPFRFRTSGKLTLPSGITRSLGCTGRVSVQIKRGSNTISTRRVSLSKTCTYSSRVSFANRRRFGSATRLKITARFLGNARVAPSAATARFARIRQS